jgi:hypothetical protein
MRRTPAQARPAPRAGWEVEVLAVRGSVAAPSGQTRTAARPRRATDHRTRGPRRTRDPRPGPHPPARRAPRYGDPDARADRRRATARAQPPAVWTVTGYRAARVDDATRCAIRSLLAESGRTRPRRRRPPLVRSDRLAASGLDARFSRQAEASPHHAPCPRAFQSSRSGRPKRSKTSAAKRCRAGPRVYGVTKEVTSVAWVPSRVSTSSDRAVWLPVSASHA